MAGQRFLTPKELAHELRIPVRRVWQLINTGKLPVVQIGPRTRRIPIEALVEQATKVKRHS